MPEKFLPNIRILSNFGQFVNKNLPDSKCQIYEYFFTKSWNHVAFGKFIYFWSGSDKEKV